MSKISRLLAGAVLQVFNLETEPPKKLGDYTHPEGDKIEYWKWIDETTIAFVTTKFVFHWTIVVNGQSPSGKTFDLPTL